MWTRKLALCYTARVSRLRLVVRGTCTHLSILILVYIHSADSHDLRASLGIFLDYAGSRGDEYRSIIIHILYKHRYGLLGRQRWGTVVNRLN